jgi:putative Mg2+ transporter-C (MgtC) family protein
MPMDQLIEMTLRLVAAAGVGAAIGINRDLHGKPAGVRMLGLVALGAALAALSAIGFNVAGEVPVDAVSRVVQGVLAGVGFLGAGVIMRDETGHVHRLNTAASVWVTATLGIACGLGAWIPAFITALLVLVLLSIGRLIDHRFYGKLESDEDRGD